MKTYAGYLFDLDGTLVDTAPDIATAFNKAMLAQGFPQSSESTVRNWVGYGARVLFTQAFEHYQLMPKPYDQALIEQMYETFRLHYSGQLSKFSKPYASVVDTLKRLKQLNIPLGVVTNKAAEFSEPLLKALNLDSYFGVIVSGDSLSLSKPAPEPALHACDILNISPQETLFVGDSITDVRCAKAAGCTVACFEHGYNHGTPAKDLGADIVFSELQQLLPAPYQN